MDELPEEGFAPRLIDTYWAKGVAILAARTSRPGIGWVCNVHYVSKIKKIWNRRYLQRLLPLAMTRLNVYR